MLVLETDLLSPNLGSVNPMHVCLQVHTIRSSHAVRVCDAPASANLCVPHPKSTVKSCVLLAAYPVAPHGSAMTASVLEGPFTNASGKQCRAGRSLQQPRELVLRHRRWWTPTLSPCSPDKEELEKTLFSEIIQNGRRL